VSANEAKRVVGFHGIEPDPDEPIYLPSGHTMQTPEEGQENVERLREEAAEEKERSAREKERAAVLREQRLCEEAASHEAWMEANSPAAKTAYSRDTLKAALFELFAEAGIDLSKVAQTTRNERLERISALSDELKQCAELTKVASTVTGLDADTAGRLRSCVEEINQLAAGRRLTPSHQ